MKNRVSKAKGTTILETLVAGTLLGTLLVVSLQMLSAATAQRHAADQRQCAIIELGNLMERIAARPWADLTSASVGEERLSPSVGSQLPGAELKIEVVADDNETDAKRITASLRWPDSSGQLIAPLTLTTWRYKIADRQLTTDN